MELIQSDIGPYHVQEEIGRGDDVVVFQATDTLYQRDVALKILPPYLTDDIEHVRAFITQGREAARLRHPNIVDVYDAGRADGYHYIAMELAEGGTLAQYLVRESDVWESEAIIAFIEQVAAALDYAHTNGFVHGRIEPGNILLTVDEQPLLTNFGIADAQQANYALYLARQADAPQLAYLSPEQARGDAEIDRRADVFGLGVLAYRLLTGQMPFEAPNSLALLRTIIEEPAPPLDEQDPSLSPAIVNGVQRALAKEPHQRWQSAGEFAHALRDLSADVEGNDAVADTPQDAASPSRATVEIVRRAAPLAGLPQAPVAVPAKRQTTHLAADPTIAPPPPRRGKRRRITNVCVLVSMLLIAILFALLVRAFAPSLQELLDGGEQAEEEAELVDAPVDPRPTAGAVLAATSTASVAPATASPINVAAPSSTITATVASEPTAAIMPVPLVTYDDPGRRFQIALPAGWRPDIRNDTIRFETGDDFPVQLFIERVPEVADETSAQMLIEVYLDETVGVDDASLQNVRSLQAQERRINGQVGYEQVLQATHFGTPVVMRLVAFAQDDVGYIVGSSADAAQEPALRPLLTSIFASFQLNPARSALVAASPSSTPSRSPSAVPTATHTPTVAVSPTAENTDTRLAYAGAGAPDVAATSTQTATPTVAATATPDALSGRIAYALWNPDSNRMDTYIYNIATGISWPKIDNKRQPDFRYDGELVFNGEGGNLENLLRMKITGAGLQLLTEHPEDSRPHWSPSGKQVVFDSTSAGDRRLRIYLQDDVRFRKKVAPMMYEAWELFGRYPVFLANHTIAYNGCNVWENGGKCGIYVTNMQGNQPRSITDWPDDLPTDNLGNQVLFMSNRNSPDARDNWDVYIVETGGGTPRRLTEHPAHDGLATASPDGRHIAFVTNRDGAWAMYVMRADGSRTRKLFDLNGEFGPGAQYWEYDWKQERLSWGK